MSRLGSFLYSLTTLSVGGRVVVARTTDSRELLALLREHQPTALSMLPAALIALVPDTICDPTTSLRCVCAARHQTKPQPSC